MCSDLGVQWDFRANCGLRGRRWFPVAALIPSQSDEPWPDPDVPPSDVGIRVVRYRAIRCEHSWMIGDYLSVCSKCLTEIPHGVSVPAYGWKTIIPKWCKVENPHDPAHLKRQIVVAEVLRFVAGVDLSSYTVRMQMCECVKLQYKSQDYAVRVVTGGAGRVKHCWVEFHTGIILDPCARVLKRPGGGDMPRVYFGTKPRWYYEGAPASD